MKRIYIIGIFIVFLVALGSGIFWLKPDTLSNGGTIIATAVPDDIELNGETMGVDGRYIPGSRIVAIQDFTDPGRREPIVLTEEFHSARAPEISYDGKSMLFAGQKSASDTWQIYLMDLKSLKVQQVSDCEENCTDPTWLPDGRIAFSRLLNEEVAGEFHALYVCNLDGSELGRLTWHPNSVYASAIFQDGRIMSLDEQKYPVNGNRKLMAARIDGSKSELYYQSPEAHQITGKSRELNGKVYFVERNNREGMPSNLISVDQGRPLSSRKNLSQSITGDFHSLYPMSDQEVLVAYRPSGDKLYGLSVFQTSNKNISDRLYSDDEYHIIEPVLVAERKVPMKLPDIVDESKDKGRLLCMNADLSMDTPGATDMEHGKATKVQVFGLEEMIGEVPLEADGSFFIEIEANTPVRFQTVDADGEILRGPSSWIYVRPNEKRSCIGCHEDRELAPENRVPDALYAGMMKLPEGSRTEAILVNGKEKGNEK